MSEHSDHLRGPAQWTGVSFHLHSPAVSSFKMPAGLNPDRDKDREEFAAQWVGRLSEAGIGLAALTDYNQVDPAWYEVLQRHAEAAGITLLAGAELVIDRGSGGLHVLLVTDAASPTDVNAAIQALHKSATPLVANRQHSPLDLSCDFKEAAARLRDMLPNVLLIPAHPENSNGGLLKSFKAGRALDILEDLEADAIEHLSDAAAAKLEAVSAARAHPFLERVVEFDDPRRLEDIGGKTLTNGQPRATWCRMSERSAAAFLTALQDPTLRVRTGGRPSEPTHARITRVRVEGAGFFRDLDVELSPHLTTLIGGRGVGKSALLQVIRYAFDEEPYRDHPAAEQLVNHALGSGGLVEVHVQHQGSDYAIRRVRGETPTVEGPGNELVQIPPSDLFGDAAGPLILGQRELQYISEEQDARRRLVDDLVGRDARALDVEVRSARAALTENAGSIERLTTQLEGRDQAEQALAAVAEDLRRLEADDGVRQLEQYRRAHVLVDSLTRAQEHAEEVNERLSDQAGSVAQELQDILADWPEASLWEPEQDDVRAELDKLHDAVVAGLQAARSAAGNFVSLIANTQQSAEQRRAGQADALADLKRDLAADQELDPDLFINLSRSKSKLDAKVAGYAKLSSELDSLRKDRKGLLQRYRDKRREAFSRRLTAAQHVSARTTGQVSVEIEDRGDADDFRQQLQKVFRGSGFRADAIDKLVEGHLDGQSIVEAADSDRGSLGISPTMTSTLQDWLKDPRNRHQLQTIAPQDHVQIRLRLPGSGDPQPLERLSLGQRATAMLLLLFATQQRPLILDQPEDDLDNRFVFDDVVKLLRRAKGSDAQVIERQVIAATHNANIPVLGDAEQVVVLDSLPGDGTPHGAIVCDGSIDTSEIRDHVRTILEGGEEAFNRRLRKYAVRGGASGPI